MTDAVFIGGPHDGQHVGLARTPTHIIVDNPNGDDWYERLDDPDTGDYLGGYVYTKNVHPRTVHPLSVTHPKGTP